MFFDMNYILFVMLPGLALSAWASMKVKSAFKKYSQVRARSGLSGAEAAKELLRQAGIHDVAIEPVQGKLSDHYDPGSKTLRLSPDVYGGRSLAALGVAAHEAGHAIQHATNYSMLKFRSAIVGPARFGSGMGTWLVMGGLLLNMSGLVWLGVIAFSMFLLFTVVTLPVEFNASSRAVAVLADSGMIAPDERAGTKKVLDAAALTYVAAAIGAALNLLYFVMLARRN